jgi:hypothetical protein
MRLFSLWCVLALVLAACDAGTAEVVVDPSPANAFAANVSGAFTASIEGTVVLQDGAYDGEFVELDSSYAGGRYVSIWLQATDTADEIRLIQFGDGLAADSYPITFMPSLEGPPYSFAAFFRQQAGNEVRTLRATEGALDVTTFSDDAIEGRFEFSGTLEGDAVTVEGTFQASRGSL